MDGGGTGCELPECQVTVCEIDPYCCGTQWDSTCAGEAADFPGVCGVWEEPTHTGDCLEPNGTPGCEILACEDAVCGIDSFCCEVVWDGICANEALNDFPELCGASGDIAKDYRHTDVCFEKDSDGDGDFLENTEEDPLDCPYGTSAGTPLPMEDGKYLVKPVVNKKGLIKSYNPGQYYAVVTATVLAPAEELTIQEDFSDCTEGDSPLSELSPVKGGGSVVVVKEDMYSGKLLQIMDAKDPNVSVDVENGTATVYLTGGLVPDDTYLVYVKFGPGLDNQEIPEKLECVNEATAFEKAATATLGLDVNGD